MDPITLGIIAGGIWLASKFFGGGSSESDNSSDSSSYSTDTLGGAGSDAMGYGGDSGGCDCGCDGGDSGGYGGYN